MKVKKAMHLMTQDGQYKLGDYDVWHKPCQLCGHDPGKSKYNRCWRCGGRVFRDFGDRALKCTKLPTQSVKRKSTN